MLLGPVRLPLIFSFAFFYFLAAPASPDPSALAKYRAGFNECASEVSRYLMSLNGMDTQVRSTLLAHLADCCNPVKSSSQETDRIQSLPQQYSPLAFGPANGPLFSPTYAKPASDTSILNGATQFQIVPGQLANGKIAAVLVPASTPTSATIVQAAPQIIPVFRPDFRGTPQAFQLQGQALRADTDPLWRPWWTKNTVFVCDSQYFPMALKGHQSERRPDMKRLNWFVNISQRLIIVLLCFGQCDREFIVFARLESGSV